MIFNDSTSYLKFEDHTSYVSVSMALHEGYALDGCPESFIREHSSDNFERSVSRTPQYVKTLEVLVHLHFAQRIKFASEGVSIDDPSMTRKYIVGSRKEVSSHLSLKFFRFVLPFGGSCLEQRLE